MHANGAGVLLIAVTVQAQAVAQKFSPGKVHNSGTRGGEGAVGLFA